MKKVFLAMVLGLCASSLMAQLKLDPAGMRLVDEYRTLRSGGEVINPDLRLAGAASLEPAGQRPMSVKGSATSLDNIPVGVIVTLAPGFTVDDLDMEGVEINTRVSDDIFTVTLPLSRLEQFSEQTALRAVSVGAPKKLHMVNARPASYVSEVQSGNGIERPYDGSGVIVGMFDTGMDPNHINFTKMGDTNTTRVQRAWAYINSTTPTYTLETPSDIANFTTENTGQSHGTHVMGIAAGAYNGPGEWQNNTTLENTDKFPLYGVATGADITMAAGTLYNAAIVDGVTRQIEYAESVGKPITINLSLGSILGPHDGTDGLSEALARLGERAIINVSAGNDGDKRLAFVMQGGGLQASGLRNTVGLGNYESGDVPRIQVWNDRVDPFTKFEFLIFNVSTKEVVYAYEIPNTNGQTVGLGGSEMGSSYTKPGQAFDDAFTSKGYITFRTFSNAGNEKYVCEINHKLFAGTNPSYKPCLRITREKDQYVYGVCGEVEFTNYSQTSTYKQDGVTYAKFTDGTTNGTISAMATGENIICVGAYTSAVNFGYLNKGGYSYIGHSEIDQIAPFSSYGINVDTKAKLPDISAPGTVILSSLNSYYTGVSNMTSGRVATAKGNYYWGPMQGTSMSCPFVTGTMALFLEADPGLKVNDVRDILAKTAVKTAQYNSGTTDLKAQWGSGKLQALEGIKEVLARKAGIGGVFADPEKRFIVEQTDGFILVTAPGETSLTARVYSTTGTMMAHGSASGETLSLSTESLASGIYILTVEGTTGRYSTKLIVR